MYQINRLGRLTKNASRLSSSMIGSRSTAGTFVNNNNNQIRQYANVTGGNIQSTSFSKTPMGVFADQLFLQPINPATNKPITDLKIDTKITLQQKYEKAYLYKDQWKNTSAIDKKIMITKFRDLLVERVDKLANDLTEESGKPITQARNEILAVVERINFFLHNFEEQVADKVIRTTDKFKELLVQEPLGVIANISAWNYPFFIGLNVIIPALLTGNCVLYKPSEFSSITGLNIMALLYESGVPEAAFQVVLGKSIISQSLLNLPIDGVFFTGSNGTGKKISETLVGRMVKTQLELGGKDAVYVHKSADIYKAAASIADGAMYNTGQGCCSVERIFVDKEVYDKFTEELVNVVKSFKFSFDPKNPKTYFGPLTRGVAQIEHLQKLIGSALKRGAILELGGNVVEDAPGFFFAPTVLSNVHENMDIQKEEIFGPVVTIQPVSGPEEAVAQMNNTAFGLTNAVYAQDSKVANFVIQKSNTGTVYWNACDRVSPYLPWSGRNASGIGSTLGVEGIRNFVRPKAIHLISPGPVQFFGDNYQSEIIPPTNPELDQLVAQKASQVTEYDDIDNAAPTELFPPVETDFQVEDGHGDEGLYTDSGIPDIEVEHPDPNEITDDDMSILEDIDNNVDATRKNK